MTTSTEPTLINKGPKSFCLIPLMTDEGEPIQEIFDLKYFKIHEFGYGKNKNFSLSLKLNAPFNPEAVDKDALSHMEFFEETFQDILLQRKDQVKKLLPNFSCNREDLKLIKKGRTNFPKIYGKLYHKGNKITCPFWEVVDWERKQKRKINPLELIDLQLQGDVVLEFKQIFCGKIKSITCIVKEVLIREIEQPTSHFEEFEVTWNSDDEYEY